MAIAAAAAAGGCGGSAVLTQLVDARRLASDLHVQFTKAADAANRSVMSDTDEASADAGREAGAGHPGCRADVQAPHIAESDDAAMTRTEAQMATRCRDCDA
jgi:hypothetical protein